MWKIVLISALFAVGLNKLAFGVGILDSVEDADGFSSIPGFMDNMMEHTTKVTNRLISQLSSSVEHSTEGLVADIEAILAQAMEQLTQPIITVQNKLESPECQNLISMDELRIHIDAQLSVCAKDLNDVMQTFQSESGNSLNALQINRAEISKLPSQCQDTDFSFGNSVLCFIEKIIELNQKIATVLNDLNMSIRKAMQMSRQAKEVAQVCIKNAVANSQEYIDDVLANCQVKE